VIAHHSVPLAIALETCGMLKKKPKNTNPQRRQEDAVQVRIPTATATSLSQTKFDVFYQWQQLINASSKLESHLERCTGVGSTPCTRRSAQTLTQAFCTAATCLKNDDEDLTFSGTDQAQFLTQLWQSTQKNRIKKFKTG